MKDLNISEYIRYLIVGLSSVVILTLISKTPIAFAGMEIIAVALVIGFIVYSLHRAILYPLLNSITLTLLHNIFYRKYNRRGTYCQLFYISKMSVEYDVLRWQSIEKESIIKHLKEWGNQIHFLYCVGWIMLFYEIAENLGLLADIFIPNYWELAIVIILVSAFLHQLRCQVYEMKILYIEKSDTNISE